MSPSGGCVCKNLFEPATESRNQQCIAQWPAKENQCNTGLLAHILHVPVPLPSKGQKDPMFMPLFFRRTSAHCVRHSPFLLPGSSTTTN